MRKPSPEPVKVVKTKDFQDEAPIQWGYKSPSRQPLAATQYAGGANGFNVTDSMSLGSLKGESPDVFLKKQA